jgi:6-phosphogluconolactonase (cycloisomerase 2 family)
MAEEFVTLFVGTYSRKESFVDGKGKGIYAFRFSLLTGELAPLGLQAETGINPSYICGTKKALYAVSECNEPLSSDATKETGFVTALAIGANGTLTKLNRHETRGTFPCYLSVNAENDFLSVANYGGGSVILFPINEDGSLAEASDFHEFSGASLVNPDRQEASHLHSTTWGPGSNFLFGADLGNDRVAQFELNKDTKKLEPNSTAAFSTRPGGSGPRHLAIHPSLKFVYVLDELANTIGVHSYDAKTGTLSNTAVQNVSTVPADFSGSSLSADIHISSSGEFVYASNRGHDSIAIYRIDQAAGGKLELVGFESTRGKSPRNFLIFRDFLLVANQDTDTIELFHIDGVNGKLTFTGVSAACPTPVSLFIAPQ